MTRLVCRVTAGTMAYSAVIVGVTGSVTVNTDPRVRREAALRVPPCACAIHWLIANP